MPTKIKNTSGVGTKYVSIYTKNEVDQLLYTFNRATPRGSGGLNGGGFFTAMTAYKLEKNTEINIDNLQDQINSLENFTNDAFEDGIVSRAEAIAIEKYINELNAVKERLDKKYSKLYNNADLPSQTAQNLLNAKNTFDTAHQNLINKITTVISDGKADQSEKTAVDNEFDDYTIALKNLEESFETSFDDITTTKADDALTAAQEYTDDLEFLMKNAFRDGVISQSEARAIKTHLKNLALQRKQFLGEYNELYNNPDLSGQPKTNLNNKKNIYITKYTNLVNAINNGIANDKVSPSEQLAIDTAFDELDGASENLERAIAQAIDYIAQSKANEAELNAKGYTDTLIGNVQDQIDGVIVQWTKKHDPTLSNEPYTNWTTSIRIYVYIISIKTVFISRIPSQCRNNPISTP